MYIEPQITSLQELSLKNLISECAKNIHSANELFELNKIDEARDKLEELPVIANEFAVRIKKLNKKIPNADEGGKFILEEELLLCKEWLNEIGANGIFPNKNDINENEVLPKEHNTSNISDDSKDNKPKDKVENKIRTKIGVFVAKVVGIFKNNPISLIGLVISLLILFFSIKFSILPFIIDQKKSELSNRFFVILYIMLSIIILSYVFYDIYKNEQIPNVNNYKDFIWIGRKWKIFVDSNNPNVLLASLICLFTSSVMLYTSGIENFFLISGYKLSIYRLIIIQLIALLFIIQFISTILIAKNIDKKDIFEITKRERENDIYGKSNWRKFPLLFDVIANLCNNIVAIVLALIFSGMSFMAIVISFDLFRDNIRRRMLGVCYFTLVIFILSYIYIFKEKVNDIVQYKIVDKECDECEGIYDFLLRFKVGIEYFKLNQKHNLILMCLYFILLLPLGILGFTRGINRYLLVTGYRLNFYRIVLIELIVLFLVISLLYLIIIINDSLI